MVALCHPLSKSSLPAYPLHAEKVKDESWCAFDSWDFLYIERLCWEQTGTSQQKLLALTMFKETTHVQTPACPLGIKKSYWQQNAKHINNSDLWQCPLWKPAGKRTGAMLKGSMNLKKWGNWKQNLVIYRKGKRVFIFKRTIHRLLPGQHEIVLTIKKISNFSFSVGKEQYQWLTWILLSLSSILTW